MVAHASSRHSISCYVVCALLSCYCQTATLSIICTLEIEATITENREPWLGHDALNIHTMIKIGFRLTVILLDNHI